MQSTNKQSASGVVTKTSSAAASVKQFVELISLDIDVERARQLQLRSKGLSSLPPTIGSILREVRKLDLASNNLTDISVLSSLPNLSNLCVSNNPQLRTLRGLGNKLMVLTVANCGLTSLSGLEASGATLRTLIANDNNIQLQSPAIPEASPQYVSAAVRAGPVVPEAVENYKVLASLQLCETIVLTRNAKLCALYPTTAEDALPPTDAAAAGEGEDDKNNKQDHGASAAAQARALCHPLSVFDQMPHLKKLSLSECGIQSLPARWFLPMVTELRFARNGLTSLQPEGVIVRSLKILDISHNQVDAIATLRRCRFLKQISVRGNPFVATYEDRDNEEERESGGDGTAVPVSLQRSLSRLLTSLESIDGHPILAKEQLVMKRRAPQEEEEGADGEPASSTAAPKARVERPAKKAKRSVPVVDRAAIAAEAEEKDVVLDSSVAVKETHAPIVRRERVNVVAKKGLSRCAGGDAVAKLMKQKKESASW